MMPMHDPDRFRRLERELEDSAELARRVRDARDGLGPSDPEWVEPTAAVTQLPVEWAAERCPVCGLQREQTSA
jgi:hypothetical protein